MLRQWYILAIIVLIYLPVSIDATVLHVAIPTLNQELQLSNNQMLWVMDIYSLMMVGLILPMGALGERIGYKRLMLTGALIFGLSSLFAAFSTSANMLILARAVLAGGAAMIIPATLAGLRHAFPDEKKRNFALGLWVVAGGGGAAFGPLIGGILLEHYHWGSIFLINIPIIVCVMLTGYYILPSQQINRNKVINIADAVLLTCAILLMVYALKAGMKHFDFTVLLIGLTGLLMGAYFLRQQRRKAQPLIDLELFSYKPIKIGFLISIFTMVALVGFELLIAQELQYVHGYTPLQAGLFILPFMLAVSVSGIFSSVLINRFGVRKVSLIGLICCAIAFIGLAGTNFSTQQYQGWLWMILLGFWVEATFLASTSAIISASPVEKATAAGSIEGMSYELGTGFGVAIFGLLVSYFYSSKLKISAWMSTEHFELAKGSIGETIQTLSLLDPALSPAIREMANAAFLSAHQYVLYLSSVTLIILTIFVFLYWSDEKAESE
ncbi:MFS transporter [Acinetobacter sp. WZC-1]|uniref:MFS transporter n=1 Tax=Acinetobacter sp. WZC-1 TaxID=3459034 RepID=UPI00403D80A2